MITIRKVEADQAVGMEQAKALEAANSTGDAQKIRAAVAQLEAAMRGEAPPPAPNKAAAEPAQAAQADGPAVGATEVVAPGQAAAEFGESAEQSPAPEDAEPALQAALRYVGSAPSRLAVCSIEDVLALPEQPNLPSTIDEHPNWRRRLPPGPAFSADATKRAEIFVSARRTP